MSGSGPLHSEPLPGCKSLCLKPHTHPCQEGGCFFICISNAAHGPDPTLI